MANKEAKLGNKVMDIDNNLQREEILKRTPIGKIWGIGLQYQKLLNLYQIETAWKFTQLNENWVKKNMSITGHHIHKELLGEPCITIENPPLTKKAIASTREFEKKIDNKELIKEAAPTHATRCAEKLRRQHSIANLLTFFIHTDPFNPNEKMYYKSQTVILPVPTNSNILLVKAATKALDSIFIKGLWYKKTGVIVSSITSENQRQGNLFFEEDSKRLTKISEATDLINRKYGRDTIKLAAQRTKGEWKHQQNKLSEEYTTKLYDIIVIKT